MSNTTTPAADEAKVRIVSTAGNTQASLAQYNYMRPNLNNNGNLPAAAPYNYCPDIWPVQTMPLANYKTVLASQPSYRSQPPNQVVLNETNYIYVRAFNGSSTTQTNSVTLYYSATNLIQYPGLWENNVILTDQGNNSGAITVAPGTVGVADATFLWVNPQPALGGVGFGLVAQFNDPQNSNPPPPADSPINMAALIQNNLQWGWSNLVLLNGPSDLTYSFNTGITVPQGFQTGMYALTANCVNFQGWQVSFQCSQTDSHGNPISLPVTNIINNNALVGLNNVVLAPGYNAVLSVYLYNPQNLPMQAGANVSMQLSYITSNAQEYDEAVAKGVVDWELTRSLATEGMPLRAIVTLGTVTGVHPA